MTLLLLRNVSLISCILWHSVIERRESKHSVIFPFHVAVEFSCAQPVQKRKHLRIRLYGIGYSPWHPSGGTLIISADLCQINFEVILLYWESPSYLLDNQSNLRNSQTERWGSFAARSASHMSSLSESGCPIVSLQGHMVGLAGSKFSLVIFLEK